jgi:PIN domain nuclease of toxin-antitoxin system
MRLLLDTHAFLWAVTDSPRLGSAAREAMLAPSAEVYVSIAAFWEIAIKVRVGTLDYDVGQLLQTARQDGFRLLAVEPRHLFAYAKLPQVPKHNDPFDHLMISQAIADRLVFLSEDERVPLYPVPRMPCSDPPPAR